MYRGKPFLLLVTSVLLHSLSTLAQSAPAQPNLRIAYTGGLFGYYRQDVADAGKAEGRPTAPSLLLDALTAETNPTSPLILGMGDNFAPEYGASLLWAGHAPAACQPPAAAPYPEALYKTDLTLYATAACDNIAAFLMQAGYRALVPGREDFIYGSVWLEHMALLLTRESGRNKPTSPQFANQDHTLQLLAANLRLQLTTNDARSKQFTVGTRTICPLLLSEPSTWGSAGGCQSGEARPEEGAVLKEVGYTHTTLGGGSNTVLIGVVGSDLLDAVSTQNKTFCGVASGSAPHLTGYTSASCQAAAGFKARVIVTDPLEAVTSAINAAVASGPVDSIIVMAQMKRGDAEELAAKLQAFARFDPKYRKIVLVISGAYAAQSSGSFSLSMKGQLSQIPVLTPHPAYDTDNLSYQQFPLVQPLSSAELNLNGSYELVSRSESAPLPLPAARSTWSLLLDELQRLQSTPAAAISSAKSRSCDAQRFYPASLPPVSSSLHQLPVDARDAIDNCDVEGMQYLLEAMRGIHPGAADVAVLERRDFFFGLLPQDYIDYNMCSKAGPPDSDAQKKCRLNVALDRVLWKGDYLEKVMLKGSDLSAMITASTTQAAQAGALAQPTTSGTWLTTFGLVKSPEGKFDALVQNGRTFAIPEDTNCIALTPSASGAQSKSYCVGANPIQSDGAYWLVTSDHLASDTTTYTALASLPRPYDLLLPDASGQPKFLTQSLTDAIYARAPAPPIDSVTVAAQKDDPSLATRDLGNQAEIEAQQKRHFQLDLGKVFFGYVNSSAIGGDQYIAQNFQGVTDSHADAVSVRELDAEDQLRGLWSWGYLYAHHYAAQPQLGHYAQHLGFGFQTDTEYDRSAQGNLNGQPANASYAGNNFAIGPLFQYSYPLHNGSVRANLGLMRLARLGFTLSPQYQRQLRGTFLYFSFSQGTSELAIPIDYSFSWNVREGLRLESAAPAKWYQLSSGSYLEFGPEVSEQHRVLSGLTLVNAPLNQQITCSASSTSTISACVSNALHAKTFTVNANVQTRNITYAAEPADGLYWDLQFKRQLLKTANQQHELDLLITSKGDAFVRRGAASVLSTQTLYDVPLNVAFTFQVLPNLSFAPAMNFFYFENQLAEHQLLIRSFNITARWYFDRDSHVPFLRQLLFQGPASGDSTRSTRMKQ